MVVVQTDGRAIAYPALQQFPTGLSLEVAQTQIGRVEGGGAVTTTDETRVDETHYLKGEKHAGRQNIHFYNSGEYRIMV